jgi:hypothetical protein
VTNNAGTFSTTINTPIVLAGAQAWSIGSGLTLGSNGTSITGAGPITKSGNGAMTVNTYGPAVHSFSGGLAISGTQGVTWNYGNVGVSGHTDAWFGTNTITLRNNGRFSLMVSGTAGSTTYDINLQNAITVEPTGGQIGFNNVKNNNDLRAAIAGPIDLQGPLTFGKFSGGGDAQSGVVKGTVTLNGTAAALIGMVSNPYVTLDSAIQDGTTTDLQLGHRNSGNGADFRVSTPATNMTYTGNTTIMGGTNAVSGQFIRILAASRLNGTVTMNAGGWLRLESATNLQSPNNVRMLAGTGSQMTSLSLTFNGDPGAIVDSANSTGNPVIFLDATNTATSINLGALANGTSGSSAFLGSTGTNTTSAVLSPGTNGEFSMGVGRGQLILSATGAISGSNTLRIGQSVLGDTASGGGMVTLSVRTPLTRATCW